MYLMLLIILSTISTTPPVTQIEIDIATPPFRVRMDNISTSICDSYMVNRGSDRLIGVEVVSTIWFDVDNVSDSRWYYHIQLLLAPTR